MFRPTIFFAVLGLLICTSLISSKKPDPNPIDPSFNYVEVNKVNKTAINLPYPGEFYTGYITVNQTSGSKIHYQLYSAGGNKRASTINDTAPFILSLSGGPGCPGGNSYYETGPFRVTLVNGTTFVPVLNDVTWNDEYHLLYVDNPVGVGYSVVADDMPAFALANGAYLVNFLKRFFELYPNLKKQDFYIQGESYGGHFVLGLATQLLANPQLGIQFKGVGMQAGWFDPKFQSTGWADGLYAAGVLDLRTRVQMNSMADQFRGYIASQDYAAAYNLTDKIEALIPKGLGFADYRNNTEWDPATIAWLNLPSTKGYLAADPKTNWQCLSLGPWFHLDFPQSYAQNVTYMLNNYNISFLVYQGQNDFKVPSAGTKHSLNNLKWTGIAGYLAAPNKVWKDTDSNVIGQYKHYGKLTYATVNKGGHNVAHDQPWSVKNLIDRWIKGTW